jgi:hypothetical protein
LPFGRVNRSLIRFNEFVEFWGKQMIAIFFASIVGLIAATYHRDTIALIFNGEERKGAVTQSIPVSCGNRVPLACYEVTVEIDRFRPIKFRLVRYFFPGTQVTITNERFNWDNHRFGARPEVFIYSPANWLAVLSSTASLLVMVRIGKALAQRFAIQSNRIKTTVILSIFVASAFVSLYVIAELKSVSMVQAITNICNSVVSAF